jgi:hypothetical protein
MGVGYFSIEMYPITGVFLGLSGAIVFPQIRRWYEDQFNIHLSRWVVVVLSLACWLIGAATIP